MALTVLFFTGLLSSNVYSFAKKSVSPPAQADDIQLNVHKRVLSNGLTIIVVENHKLPVFSFNTYYKVGSKFESPGITGSSHLLEHMMFKGAKKYGEGQFDKVVEGNGGTNNAYTSMDLTVYYEHLPAEHFELIADLEADRMQNLLLAKESFEKERLVVLEERKMRYENSDRGKIYLEMMKYAYRGTPYETSTIGEVEDLKTVSREEVWDYFKKYYTPNNAVVVIAGDLKANKVFDVMEEKFSKIPRNDKLDEIKKKHLQAKGFKFKPFKKKHIKLKGTTPIPMFNVVFKGVKVDAKEVFALDILSSILGSGESSILHSELVVSKKPLLTKVYAANFGMQESGIFFIGGKLLDKKRVRDAVSRVKKVIKNSCKNKISKRAMDKVLNQYLVQKFSGLDSNGGIASFIGDREVYYGNYEFYKEEFKKYRAVTVEDIKKVCQKYILDKDHFVVSIWNKY